MSGVRCRVEGDAEVPCDAIAGFRYRAEPESTRSIADAAPGSARGRNPRRILAEAGFRAEQLAAPGKNGSGNGGSYLHRGLWRRNRSDIQLRGIAAGSYRHSK